MTTQQPSYPAPARELLCLLSGSYSAPFWDEIYNTTNSLQTIQEIQQAITILHQVQKDLEAYHLILAIYELLSNEPPSSLLELEEYPEAISIFINEFLLDTEDLMFDYNSSHEGAC